MTEDLEGQGFQNDRERKGMDDLGEQRTQKVRGLMQDRGLRKVDDLKGKMTFKD